MWDLIVSVPDHCLSFYFKVSLTNFWGVRIFKKFTVCGGAAPYSSERLTENEMNFKATNYMLYEKKKKEKKKEHMKTTIYSVSYSNTQFFRTSSTNGCSLISS